MTSPAKIAVIGAGLAGIAAARRLTERGAKVVVFEKSRGYGGRCSSKKWEGQVIDHGAQYFTQLDSAFQDSVTRACGGRVKALRAPILTSSGDEWKGGPRYYHVAGNSLLVRELAENLDVRIGTLIEGVNAEGSGWKVGDEIFDQILSTAPLPQTRKMAGLDMGISEYVSCLTLLLLYEGDKLGKTKGVYAIADSAGSDLIWTACENHKETRVQPGKTALVAHASAAFSARFIEADPQSWSKKLRSLAEQRWRLPPEKFKLQYAHRWRYARVTATSAAPQLPQGWHFAGDALTESRVESAWLAGTAVAERLPL